jgi:hypothetical protein
MLSFESANSTAIVSADKSAITSTVFSTFVPTVVSTFHPTEFAADGSAIEISYNQSLVCSYDSTLATAVS